MAFEQYGYEETWPGAVLADPSKDGAVHGFADFTAFCTFRLAEPSARPEIRPDELEQNAEDKAAIMHEIGLERKRATDRIEARDAHDLQTWQAGAQAAQNAIDRLVQQHGVVDAELTTSRRELEAAVAELTEARNARALKFVKNRLNFWQPGRFQGPLTRERRKAILRMPNGQGNAMLKIQATQYLNRETVALSHLSPLYKQVQRCIRAKERARLAYEALQARLDPQRVQIQGQIAAQRAILQQLGQQPAGTRNIKRTAIEEAWNVLAQHQGKPRKPSHILEEVIVDVISFNEIEVHNLTDFMLGAFSLWGMKEKRGDVLPSISAANGSSLAYHVYLRKPKDNTWLTMPLVGRQLTLGVVGRFEATSQDNPNEPPRVIRTYEYAEIASDPSANKFAVMTVDYLVKDKTVKSVSCELFNHHLKFRKEYQVEIAQRYKQAMGTGRQRSAEARRAMRVFKCLESEGLQSMAPMWCQLNADLAQLALFQWYGNGLRISDWQDEDLRPYCEERLRLLDQEYGTRTSVRYTEKQNEADRDMRDKCECVLASTRRQDFYNRTKGKTYTVFHNGVGSADMPRAASHQLQYPCVMGQHDDTTNEAINISAWNPVCALMTMMLEGYSGNTCMEDFFKDQGIWENSPAALLMCRLMRAAHHQHGRDWKEYEAKTLVSDDILHGDDRHGLYFPARFPFRDHCPNNKYMRKAQMFDIEGYGPHDAWGQRNGQDVPMSQWTFPRSRGPYPSHAIKASKAARKRRQRLGERGRFSQGLMPQAT